MPTCPVCGYPDLEEPPRSASGGGSYEICPSCGFQFGVDDDDKGITQEEWRARWTEKGSPWSSRGIPKPKGWSAVAQLATLISAAAPAKKKTTPKKEPAKATKPVPVQVKSKTPKKRLAMPRKLPKKSSRKKW